MGNQRRARRERAMARAQEAPVPSRGAAFGIGALEDSRLSARDAAWLEQIKAVAAVERIEPEPQLRVEEAPGQRQLDRRDPRRGLLNGRAQSYVPRLDYDRTVVTDLVARRRRVRRELVRIESAIEHQVEQARSCGLSWDEIGQLLGITRQGARQHYGAQSVHKAAATAPSTNSVEDHLARSVSASLE
ncbi:hypothetical protein HP550_14430 [Cellulomonas humilata]|uniref:Uncharacterized protein n=1 Tax=Cellulomonas humilata TaxID=144055 RepID=A0A7Y6A3X5_9CELL|nr:hypothetical protein [Cellulomonas humilata]NUU18450.1 hypothetical protein [Cellulomonas humilata]